MTRKAQPVPAAASPTAPASSTSPPGAAAAPTNATSAGVSSTGLPSSSTGPAGSSTPLLPSYPTASPAVAGADTATLKAPIRPPISYLKGHFLHDSKAGRHAVLVLEPCGDDMGSVTQRFVGGMGLGLPMPVVQMFAKQTLEALDYLHRCACLVVGLVIWVCVGVLQAACAGLYSRMYVLTYRYLRMCLPVCLSVRVRG